MQIARVTIKVMDSDQTKLADGEMETGTYNVYYKSYDGRSDRTVSHGDLP